MEAVVHVALGGLPGGVGAIFCGAIQGGSNYISSQRAAGSTASGAAQAAMLSLISVLAGSWFAWGLRTPTNAKPRHYRPRFAIPETKGGSDYDPSGADPRSSITQDETDQAEDRNRSLAEARGGWQHELPASPAPIIAFLPTGLQPLDHVISNGQRLAVSATGMPPDIGDPFRYSREEPFACDLSGKSC